MVDTADVGAQLLSNGGLQRKTTFIPLDKIKAPTISTSRLSTAKKLTNGGVQLAVSLVDYNPEVGKSVQYVFGATLVAKDVASAKTATFDERVAMVCVTLDGDIYKPDGQLSGGSSNKNNGGGILSKLHKIKVLRTDYRKKEIELSQIQQELDHLTNINVAFTDLSKLVAFKQHELSNLQKRLENNPHSKLINKLNRARKDLADNSLLIEAAFVKISQATSKVAGVEKDMIELSNDRDSKLESLRVYFY